MRVARSSGVDPAMTVPSRAGEVWRVVRRDAGRHPSPNGGVVEAAFAADPFGGRIVVRGVPGSLR